MFKTYRFTDHIDIERPIIVHAKNEAVAIDLAEHVNEKVSFRDCGLCGEPVWKMEVEEDGTWWPC